MSFCFISCRYVYEHGLVNGQAAQVCSRANTHTRAHACMHGHTTRHVEPVPQLSSHRIQRCKTFPRGSFCSLECNHHETNPQISFFFSQIPCLALLGSACSKASLYLPGSLSQSKPSVSYCSAPLTGLLCFETTVWKSRCEGLLLETPASLCEPHSPHIYSRWNSEFVWVYICLCLFMLYLKMVASVVYLLTKHFKSNFW